MQVQTRKVIDGQTCNATATVYSLVPEDDPGNATNSWLTVENDDAIAIFTYGTSATGTVNYDVWIDVAPVQGTIAYNSSDAWKYIASQITTVPLATDATLFAFDWDDLKAAGLPWPAAKLRVRVVGTSDNPADSVIHVWVLSQQLTG